MSKKNLMSRAIIITIMTIALATTALAAPTQSDVYRFADMSQVAGASASLVRADKNISMTIQTSDLDPGAAYTVWWVIFNHPENCVAGVPGLSNCGEMDIFDADGNLIVNPDGTFGTPGVHVSVLFAAGHVISGNGVGNFAGHLQEGSLKGEVLFGEGLEDAQGAEAHLVVRTHGDPIPGMVDEQISTFAGGCAINMCADQQFAIFVP